MPAQQRPAPEAPFAFAFAFDREVAGGGLTIAIVDPGLDVSTPGFAGRATAGPASFINPAIR